MAKESNLTARQAIAILIVDGRIAASNNTAIFRVAMHCSIVDASHSETLFPKRARLRLIAAQISLSFKHLGANNRSSRPRFRDSRNRQLNPSPCWILRGSRTINCILEENDIDIVIFFLLSLVNRYPRLCIFDD